MRHVRSRAGSQITLEEAKKRAQESEEKLKRFASDVKTIKKKTDQTQCHKAWQQTSSELASERRNIEKELSAAYATAMESCGTPLVVLMRERQTTAQSLREDSEALFQQVFNLKAKIKRWNPKQKPEEVQNGIDDLRRKIQSELQTLQTEVGTLSGEVGSETVADGFPYSDLMNINKQIQSFMASAREIEFEDENGTLTMFEEAMILAVEEARTKIDAEDEVVELTPQASSLSTEDVSRIDIISAACGSATCSEVLQRLRVEFPQIPQNVLREMYMSRQKRKYLTQKRKLILQNCKNKVEEIYNSLKEVISANQEICAMRRIAEKEDSLLEARQRHNQEVLEHLRAVKQEKDALEAQKLKEQTEEEEKTRQALIAARTAEYQKRLQTLMEYKQRREMERQQEEAEAQRLQAEEAEKMNAQRNINAVRVQYREQELQRKKQKSALNKLLRDAEHEDMLERLENLVLQAKEELGVLYIERDGQRAIQDTASSAQTDTRIVGIAEAASKGQRINGYTTDKLLKDPRFRMQEALAKAGLLTTSYARTMLFVNRPAPTRAVLMNATSTAHPLSLEK
eukprot:PhF_6_TR36040/c0_g1_i1/m.52256